MTPAAEMTVNGVPVCFGDIGALPKAQEFKYVTSIHCIADSNTKRHCLPAVLDNDFGREVHQIVITAGEHAKMLSTCKDVWGQLVAQGADRGSMVINVGGGMVTDLGGFCAATYMRGIPFIHVPTSLLAMTDAAIGGKHGVDFAHYKNYVGVFASPQRVWVDTGFLKTLPARQTTNGLAEVIKHGCIADVGLLEMVENIKAGTWLDLLLRSVQVKKAFVEKDPHEQGLRAALNFGHTIGHAIESFALQKNLDILHGEAVALGIQVEARISARLLTLSPAHINRLDELMTRTFPGLRVPQIAAEDLMDFIAGDKKNRGGVIKCALLRRLGHVVTGQEVSWEVVSECWNEFRRDSDK